MAQKGYQSDPAAPAVATNSITELFVTPAQQNTEFIQFTANRYQLVNGNLILCKDLRLEVFGNGFLPAGTHLFNLPAPLANSDGSPGRITGSFARGNGGVVAYTIAGDGRVIFEQGLIVTIGEAVINIQPYLAQNPLVYPPDFNL